MFYTVDDDDFAVDSDFIEFLASEANIDAVQRRSCFNVFITDDSISENMESFSLFLELDTSFVQSRIIVQPNVTEISIIDDDGEFVHVYLWKHA